MASTTVDSMPTMRSTTVGDVLDVGTFPEKSDGAYVPEPGPGFLLVRNLAASINPVDKYIGAGMFATRHPIFDFSRAARAFGSDFAGIVVGIGEGATVTDLDGKTRPARPGDLVFGDGIIGTGSFAEFVCVLGAQAVVKPHGLSFV